LIQGLLPRPSELEVYLGDAGIYYRTIAEAQPVGAGATAELVAGIALYTF
jgi:ATP-dependent Clp protease ATP-binding subunit ClpC